MNDKSMTDEDFDADGLAALAGSVPPPEVDDDDDDDDALLDLRALASSMAPPAPAEADDAGTLDLAAAAAPAAAVAAAGGVAKAAAAEVTEKVVEKVADVKAGAAATAASAAAAGSAATAVAKSEPVAAVKAPVAAQEAKSGNGGMMFVGLGLMLGLLGIGYFAFANKGEPQETVASNTPSSVQAPEPVAPPAPAAAPAVAEVVQEAADEATDVVEEATEAVDEAVDEATDAVEEAAAPDAVEEGPEPTDAAGRARRRRRRAAAAAAATMETADTPTMETVVTMEDPAPAAMVAAMTAPMTEMAAAMTDRDMDDLLDSALGGRPTAGGTMTEPTMMAAAMEDTANLPETPSRAAVTRALGGLMPRIRRCAGDQVGLATARLRVRNDGSVASANVGGSPFGGTPQGACMERIVRTARFPRFRRTTFDVTYPFSIRALN